MACLCIQEAFFYLALTNTRRVARLASSPEGLACWALEILKDAAEGALKFVQDYDTSALGLGQVLEASGSHDQVSGAWGALGPFCVDSSGVELPYIWFVMR